jgi:transaldolase
MEAARKFHELGQSLWLDNITRDQLNSGFLKHAIEEWSVTGLIFKPAAFNHAIMNSGFYDAAIHKKLKDEIVGEELFYELALEDLRHAADLLRPIYDNTKGMDGWVSLDVSPLMAHDTTQILTKVQDLYVRAQRPNFLIAIPGTKKNLPVIEEAILTGIPVNVTLLFSCEHYLEAAEAFLRGIERRIKAGIRPKVGSVASFPIRQWDTTVEEKVPDVLRNQLGVAMGRRIYKNYNEFLNSRRWKRAYSAGARSQRILWLGTETKDQKIPYDFYIKNLAAPSTISTMDRSTLKAFSDRADLDNFMPPDGGDCEIVLHRFTEAGIDIDAMADRLQEEGVALFVKSWVELMMSIASKSASLMHEEGKGEADKV